MDELGMYVPLAAVALVMTGVAVIIGVGHLQDIRRERRERRKLRALAVAMGAVHPVSRGAFGWTGNEAKGWRDSTQDDVGAAPSTPKHAPPRPKAPAPRKKRPTPAPAQAAYPLQAGVDPVLPSMMDVSLFSGGGGDFTSGVDFTGGCGGGDFSSGGGDCGGASFD